MKHDEARFAQVAKRVWGVDTAEEGIEAFRSFLISIGMPSTLGELGGKEEDIPTLVKNLCYGDGRDGTISGFVTLNEDDCTKIYKNMI
jgi:alcohol dehydrogenase YqhD (iron-dependent ADH family)